jgi:hypothetical protein
VNDTHRLGFDSTAIPAKLFKPIFSDDPNQLQRLYQKHGSKIVSSMIPMPSPLPQGYYLKPQTSFPPAMDRAMQEHIAVPIQNRKAFQ